MIISILQSNYIPWKGYFDIIAQSDVFVIYDEVQYTKNDWRNRNLIKTPQGKKWITIPVRHHSSDQKIFEIKVNQVNWAKKHIGMLQANYARAPFFKDVKGFIYNLYNIKTNKLSEINASFIKSICNYLEIDTKIIDSRELKLKGNSSERLVDACKKLCASTYLSGPSAKNYLDLSLFESEGIEIAWMDYSNYPEYRQLHGHFEHGVTILDLIFNEGPQAANFMKYLK